MRGESAGSLVAVDAELQILPRPVVKTRQVPFTRAVAGSLGGLSWGGDGGFCGVCIGWEDKS